MRWLYDLYFNYVWPSLKGNGPEALVQTVVYGILALIFVPPVRRWAEKEAKHLHAKIDHVIKHSTDIPPFPGTDNPEPEQDRPVRELRKILPIPVPGQDPGGAVGSDGQGDGRP